MPRRNKGQFDAYFFKDGYRPEKGRPVHLIPRGRPAPPRPEHQAKPEQNQPTDKDN